jgi:hypothetical protein
MRVRWIGLALALVLVGLVGGYAVGHVSRDEPAGFASAAPVAALNPSTPIEPVRPYTPDIDYPALEPGLDYRRHLIGDPPFQWAYAAPVGWTQVEEMMDEIRWRPTTEPNIGGYSLRVKLINQHQTPEQMVAEKIAAVEDSYQDVVVLARTDDTLTFRYRDPVANHKRFNSFRWFTANGGTEAIFEMSVVGRAVDRDGLDDMLIRVSQSIHEVEDRQ